MLENCHNNLIIQCIAGKTFRLWLYGIKHMAKDHTDKERWRKEGNVLFNDTLNTFYLWLYGVRHMVKDHSDSERGNPLPPHGLLFLISCKGSLYASSHRQDSTYHSLYCTSCGALAWMKNNSMGPPWRIDPMTHRIISERSYHRATSHSQERWSPLPSS